MAYQRIKLILLSSLTSFLFFMFLPIIIPIITIHATKTCFIMSKFLFKGHLISTEIKIPEIISSIKPAQRSLIIGGIIFLITFPISSSFMAFEEIIEAIVAPPRPKAKPIKCKKLNISNNTILNIIYKDVYIFIFCQIVEEYFFFHWSNNCCN